MSPSTFDAIDLALLIIIGVAAPLVCVGGIGLAYRAQERSSARKGVRTGQATRTTRSKRTSNV